MWIWVENTASILRGTQDASMLFDDKKHDLPGIHWYIISGASVILKLDLYQDGGSKPRYDTCH